MPGREEGIPMEGYVLLDAGGTEIKSAAFSDAGRRLDEIHSAPSRAREDRERILGNMLDVIAREKQVLEAGGYRLGTVGMAFPGPFDYPNGISHIRGLDKYDAIDGVALEGALKSIPGQDVLAPDVRFFFRHDVDSFALGTAAREPACAGGRTICLAIGTGTGSAFLEEGRLVKKGKGAPDDGWIYPFPELQRHRKFPFELEFLVMDPGYNELNRLMIETNAAALGIPVTIFETDIFDIVDAIPKSPCYLCARMRRGYLYRRAKELGCNKIALGHHYDDVIETILMGMLWSGQFQTMMPKVHSQNFEGMELIRKLHETNPDVEANLYNTARCVNLDKILGYKRKGEEHSFLDDY